MQEAMEAAGTDFYSLASASASTSTSTSNCKHDMPSIRVERGGRVDADVQPARFEGGGRAEDDVTNSDETSKAQSYDKEYLEENPFLAQESQPIGPMSQLLLQSILKLLGMQDEQTFTHLYSEFFVRGFWQELLSSRVLKKVSEKVVFSSLHALFVGCYMPKKLFFIHEELQEHNESPRFPSTPRQ